MKGIILAAAAVFSLSATANVIDLGITPAADSLQAKLEQILQSYAEKEEAENVDPSRRLVQKTASGGYAVEGEKGRLECQEYSPAADTIGIQIQRYGCKLEVR